MMADISISDARRVFTVNGIVGFVDDGKAIRLAANLDDIGARVLLPRFGVIRVNGLSLERANRILHEAASLIVSV